MGLNTMHTVNRSLKNDLYEVLRKHSVGFDECIEALDEMFYENYNSAGHKISYTGSPVRYYRTKGNSE
jgi:hypothetical protein